MDIEKLVETSRARFNHDAHRQILKEKYNAKLTFAYADGLWRAGPELLNLLNCCHDEEAVILDLYENPVLINVAELSTMANSHWQEQMNAWLIEHEQARQQR